MPAAWTASAFGVAQVSTTVAKFVEVTTPAAQIALEYRRETPPWTNAGSATQVSRPTARGTVKVRGEAIALSMFVRSAREVATPALTVEAPPSVTPPSTNAVSAYSLVDPASPIVSGYGADRHS